MLVVTLNEAEVQVVKGYVTALKSADTKGLAMFEMVCKLYDKHIKDNKTKAVGSAINKAINALYKEQDINITAYLKKIVTTAISFKSFNFNYVDDKGLSKLTYKTIENVVKLLQFVSDNEGEIVDTFQTVRDDIDDVLSIDFLGKINYNNAINEKVAEIKKRNNIKGQDDALTLGVDGVILGVQALSTKEDFQKVMEAMLKRAEELGLNKSVA